MDSAKPVAAGSERGIGWCLTALILLAFGLAVRGTWFHAPSPGWCDAILLLTMAVVVLARLTRELPLQNVLFAAGIIGAIGSGVSLIGSLAHLRFSPRSYAAISGPRFFDTLPWAIPLIWIVLVLTARGVARLLLRPWRASRSYGFLVIGSTALLSLIADVGLHFLATERKHYWTWRSTAAVVPVSELVGKLPWQHFAVWTLTAVLVLVVVTPVLIRKKPGDVSPDYQPLLLWVLLNVYFAAGALGSGAVLMAVFSLVAAVAPLWVVRRGHFRDTV